MVHACTTITTVAAHLRPVTRNTYVTAHTRAAEHRLKTTVLKIENLQSVN